MTKQYKFPKKKFRQDFQQHIGKCFVKLGLKFCLLNMKTTCFVKQNMRNIKNFKVSS